MGGDWYNPLSWFSDTSNTDTYAAKKSISDTIFDWGQSINNGIGNIATSVSDSAKSGLMNVSNSVSSLNNNNAPANNSVPQQPQYNQSNNMNNSGTNSYGGRRRHKKHTMRGCKNMKGGKGGLGLTYYASPVSGLQVAKPTYWINSNTNQNVKGGTRKHKRRKH